MYVFINYSQLNLEILQTGFEYICIRSIFETGKENLKYYICQRVNVDCINFFRKCFEWSVKRQRKSKTLAAFFRSVFFRNKRTSFY